MKSTSHFLPQSSVSKIRFKFRRQFQLLTQIRFLTTFRVEGSIISIGNNTTDTIIRRSLMYSRKCRTKNGLLRNSGIN